MDPNLGIWSDDCTKFFEGNSYLLTLYLCYYRLIRDWDIDCDGTCVDSGTRTHNTIPDVG